MGESLNGGNSREKFNKYQTNMPKDLKMHKKSVGWRVGIGNVRKSPPPIYAGISITHPF